VNSFDKRKKESMKFNMMFILFEFLLINKINSQVILNSTAECSGLLIGVNNVGIGSINNAHNFLKLDTNLQKEKKILSNQGGGKW